MNVCFERKRNLFSCNCLSYKYCGKFLKCLFVLVSLPNPQNYSIISNLPPFFAGQISCLIV